MPKHFLDQWLPALFKSFWDTSLYQIGIALPLTVLACLGLKAALSTISPRRHAALLIAVVALTAFEFYQPRNPQINSAVEQGPLEWLRTEANQDQIRLIHLPMGRFDSKYYGYLQTLSGYPHVEGLASRTPPGAYDYINGNLILKGWRRETAIRCLPASRALYLAALEALQADGFTHVTLQYLRTRGALLLPSFASVQPAYQNGFFRVYRLEQLRDSCESQSVQAPEPFTHFENLALSSAITADQGMSILSFHPSERIDDGSFRDLSSLLLYWKDLAHVYLRDGELKIQSARPEHTDVSRFLEQEQLILFLHNPSQAGADDLRPLLNALAGRIPNLRCCH